MHDPSPTKSGEEATSSPKLMEAPPDMPSDTAKKKFEEELNNPKFIGTTRGQGSIRTSGSNAKPQSFELGKITSNNSNNPSSKGPKKGNLLNKVETQKQPASEIPFQ
jgi:hypothetical protein